MLQSILDKSAVVKDGAIQSMNPPEAGFNYLYFSHCIPPQKPRAAVILGYGDGTIAKLMRKVWGDYFTIEKVDIAFKGREPIDARDWVKNEKEKWDYVCIDLWNGSQVCDFIFDKSFARKIRDISTGFVCMNIPESRLMDAGVYAEAGFNFDRMDRIMDNAVVWWSVR